MKWAWNKGSLDGAQIDIAKIHHYKTICKVKISTYVLGTLDDILLALSHLILNTPLL